VGIAQLVAHEAGDCILCREGSDVLFPNDFGEDLSSNCFCQGMRTTIFNQLLLPARRYASAVLVMALCPSVGPSVTSSCSVETVA